MKAAIIGFAVAFLCIGCGGSKAPAKKYTAVPVAQPMFQVIPANVDPNTARIPGAPGNIVQNAQPDGRSWALDSTRVWQPFPDGQMSTYTTPLVDATVTADNIPFLRMPLRPGYLFVSRLYTTLLHDAVGTATGSLVWSAGNDGPRQNTLGPVTWTAGSINGLVGITPYPAFGNGAGFNPFSDAGTAIVAKITTAVTGMSSMHVSFSVHGFWVPE